MGFRPDTILLLDLGKYGSGSSSSRGNSVAQLPFIYNDGFRELCMLADPEKTKKHYNAEISEESLRYIMDVRNGVSRFPPVFKCRGFGRDCKEYATDFAIPYSIDRNFERKIISGGPVDVKQTHVLAGRFLCDQCADFFYSEKGCKVYRIPIGLSIPREIIKELNGRDVNFNRGDFHRVIKHATAHIPEFPSGEMIDTGQFTSKAPAIGKGRAQEIMARLCGRNENLLPQDESDYFSASVMSYSPRGGEQLDVFQ